VAELGYLPSGSETAASQEPQAQPDATQVTFVVDKAVQHVTQSIVASVHGNKEMGEVEVCLHSFLTSASDGGERSYSHSGKTGSAPIKYEAAWTPEPVWTLFRGS